MVRAWTILGLVILTVATVPVQALSKASETRPQPAPQAEDIAQTERKAEPHPGSSIRTPLYVKPSCDHGCGYSENTERWWERLWSDPVATFTAILALFTLVLAGATVRLWSATVGLRFETKRLAEDSQKQLEQVGESVAATNALAVETAKLAAENKVQAEAMRESLIVARKANEISEAALIASHRPWVGLDQVNVKPPVAGQQFYVHIQTRNCGGSPAFQLRGGFVPSFVVPGDAEPPPLGPLGQQIDERSTLLPSITHEYYPFAPTQPLTPAQVGAITSGALVPWIVGRIEYVDSSGVTHHTSFRMKYRVATNGFGATALGNEAD
jgi:hypothetical protein